MAVVRASLTIAVYVLMAGSSLAGEAECKTIADALMRMIGQPIVRQIENRSDFPGPIETVFTRDAMYVTAGGRWKKIDVAGSARVAQLEHVLKQQPLQECRKLGDAPLDGVATSHFTYAQARVDKPLEMFEMQVWIGTADGLPRRWQGGPSVSVMTYVGVAVPAP